MKQPDGNDHSRGFHDHETLNLKLKQSNLKMKKFWNKQDRKGRSFAKPLGRIAAKIAGGGGAAGATTGLAAVFGTASTGTAISSLSGAAAMNATLAWLGGGAIAVGGFGMIGGAAVLTAVGVGGAYGAQKLYDYVVK